MNVIGQISRSKLLMLIVFTFGLSLSVFADQLMLFPLNSNPNTNGGLQSGTMTINASNPAYTGSYLYTNGWNNDGDYNSYETSAINTTGYYNIVVSASLYSQANGVRDMQLQYKVGSTGSWTGVENFSLTTTATNYLGTLPDECNNKSQIYVRWIATSYTSVAGASVSSFGRNYIYSASITGDLPLIPNTQSHTLRFVAITPTTIRVSCTPGNGDHRIIVMNTTNSFTEPVNDYNPTATANYNGGEQIIYNGTGSYVTAIVPSASNEYYFRIYDYKYNGGMSRYVTSVANQNPRLCALEGISINAVTNIRLTRATFNATIDPKKSTIFDRGFVWSLTSGDNFDISTNKFSEYGTTDGGFNLNFPDNDYGTSEMPRGQLIYVKAFVENLSGTIYTDEYTFSNVPVFSGNGNWEDANKWSVNEVPGADGDATYGSIDDSPIINANCVLNSSNRVTDLTINSGRGLTISPETMMQVEGTLTNNNGVQGIKIQATSTEGNGSLVYSSGNNVQARVEMYSKAYFNRSNPEGSQYAWQYFGIPVTSLAHSPTFTNGVVREWDESVVDYYDIWVRRNNGSSLKLSSGATLIPGIAYELVQSANRIYTFAGTLNHSDYNKSLDYSSSAYYKGQNMLSNPYTASMDIRDLSFGSNTTAAVYLFNTGTYNDWLTNGGESSPGEGPGTYTVSTPGTAGANGVPLEIPSMQGFIVKATGSGGSVSFSYNDLLEQTVQQRSTTTDVKVSTRIDLIGANFNDRMWLFIDETCTDGFDNGFDGAKLLGHNEQSQIYGVGSDDIYQINVINDINSSIIGVQPGNETSLKLVFNHENMDVLYRSLYLIDDVAKTTVDITENGSEYSFTASQNDSVKRFRIVTDLTAVDNTDLVSSDLIYTSENILYVNNKTSKDGQVFVYDISGKLIVSSKLVAKSKDMAISNLKHGTYIVRIVLGSQQISENVIIN